jgi:hypothetical protein
MMVQQVCLRMQRHHHGVESPFSMCIMRENGIIDVIGGRRDGVTFVTHLGTDLGRAERVDAPVRRGKERECLSPIFIEP